MVLEQKQLPPQNSAPHWAEIGSDHTNLPQTPPQSTHKRFEWGVSFGVSVACEDEAVASLMEHPSPCLSI